MSVTSVTCPASVTYTGSALEPCSAVVTSAGGLNSPLSVSYATSDNTDAGTASASASYPGDANHSASSDSTTFTIDQAVSTVSVASDDNSSIFSEAVTFTATISGYGAGSSTGSVDFVIDSVSHVVTVSSNQAQLAISTLTVGNHTVHVDYSGDSNLTPSSGDLSRAARTSSRARPPTSPSRHPPRPRPARRSSVTVTALDAFNNTATGDRRHGPFHQH